MGDINTELVSLIKDIRDYIALQDAEQERAKIDKTPKMQDTIKAIKGGSGPANKPSPGIAKQMIRVPTEGSTLAEIRGTAVEPKEDSFLKEDKLDNVPIEDEGEEVAEEIPVEEEGMEEDVVDENIGMDEEGEEESSNMEEMKSLLKDIKGLLSSNSTLRKELGNIKKSIPELVEKGVSQRMRKMGYIKSKPSISRIGIDKENEIKKSADSKPKEDLDSVLSAVDNFSKMSFEQLANKRIELGDLKPFSPYVPTKK